MSLGVKDGAGYLEIDFQLSTPFVAVFKLAFTAKDFTDHFLNPNDITSPKLNEKGREGYSES